MARAEAHAADHDVGEVDVARELRALGTPADVQPRAHGAGDRDVRRRRCPGSPASGQLVERHVDIEVLVLEADLAADVERAAGAPAEVQLPDRERLALRAPTSTGPS